MLPASAPRQAFTVDMRSAARVCVCVRIRRRGSPRCFYSMHAYCSGFANSRLRFNARSTRVINLHSENLRKR